MNKNTPVNFMLLFITIMLAQTTTAYDLSLGTNTVDVSFGDTPLSTTVKDFIVADLQRCVEFWGEGSKLRFRNDAGFVGYIDNPTLFPYYRDGLVFPDNLVTNQNGDIALHVSANLCLEYTNALAFASANSNIVADARNFIAFVASTNFLNISSNQMVNYVLEKNASSDYYAKNYTTIISELRDQQYFQPSILGFYYSEQGPASSNLWLNVPCTSDSGYAKPEWSAFPAIWHDGKWKFCFWDATE